MIVRGRGNLMTPSKGSSIVESQRRFPGHIVERTLFSRKLVHTMNQMTYHCVAMEGTASSQALLHLANLRKNGSARSLLRMHLPSSLLDHVSDSRS